jgi:hypothetical protein
MGHEEIDLDVCPRCGRPTVLRRVVNREEPARVHLEYGSLQCNLSAATVVDEDDEEEIGIKPCGRCGGEGCKVCDDTGVIYP